MHASEQISLRLAVTADLPEMLRLFRTTILTACTADYSSEQLAAWASSADDGPRWEGYLRELDVILAVVDERIAGFGALKVPAHIELMYVHPDFHRRGIAGKLMEALLAKTEGPVTAHVSRTARPFFEREGFAVTEALFPVRNGIVIPNFSMRKANW